MNSSIIFDIHIDIPQDKLDTDLGSYDWDDIPRAERTKLEFNKYKDLLQENKRSYAELIGVDYRHYTRDSSYLQFLAWMQGRFPYLSEYLVVNFYKLYLMEELAKEYDKVLYCDFDVYFYTDKNYFDQFGDEGIYLSTNTEINGSHWDGNKMYLRSELNKWYIAYAMLMEEFEEYTAPVTNTGLILASSKWIKQLNFMEQLPDMIRLVTHIKQGSDYLAPEIVETMDWNNEPFYSYASQKTGVPLIDNSGPWNLIVNYGMTKEVYDSAPKEVVHMILKRFDWIWH